MAATSSFGGNMADIIPLFKPTTEPRVRGPAKCLQCKHEWEADVLGDGSGFDGFECPECGMLKGYFNAPWNIRDGEQWFCQCGSHVFQVGETGVQCCHCGNAWNFSELCEE